jgi:hypothetical protein
MRPPSDYLRRRMALRRIATHEIDEALDNRETEYPSADHPDRKVILGRTRRDRRLKVVVLVADEEFVITVADRDDEV